MTACTSGRTLLTLGCDEDVLVVSSGSAGLLITDSLSSVCCSLIVLDFFFFFFLFFFVFGFGCDDDLPLALFIPSSDWLFDVPSGTVLVSSSTSLLSLVLSLPLPLPPLRIWILLCKGFLELSAYSAVDDDDDEAGTADTTNIDDDGTVVVEAATDAVVVEHAAVAVNATSLDFMTCYCTLLLETLFESSLYGRIDCEPEECCCC